MEPRLIEMSFAFGVRQVRIVGGEASMRFGGHVARFGEGLIMSIASPAEDDMRDRKLFEAATQADLFLRDLLEEPQGGLCVIYRLAQWTSRSNRLAVHEGLFRILIHQNV